MRTSNKVIPLAVLGTLFALFGGVLIDRGLTASGASALMIAVAFAFGIVKDAGDRHD